MAVHAVQRYLSHPMTSIAMGTGTVLGGAAAMLEVFDAVARIPPTKPQPQRGFQTLGIVAFGAAQALAFGVVCGATAPVLVPAVMLYTAHEWLASPSPTDGERLA